jgi:hypothetical protein
MSKISRRAYCLSLPLWTAVASAHSESTNSSLAADDRCYRRRAESLDQLVESAKAAVKAGKLPREAYAPLVEWLYEQQGKLYDEVRAHRFTDITEVTYWQRSRLKFPSVIDQERDALSQP